MTYEVTYIGDDREDAYFRNDWVGEARSVQEAIEIANQDWEYSVEDGERYLVKEGDNAPKTYRVTITRTFKIEEIA